MEYFNMMVCLAEILLGKNQEEKKKIDFKVVWVVVVVGVCLALSFEKLYY